ncbi:MAG: hypothetical protein ACRDNY_10435 [Gaiellaceae bacterium]
MRRAVAVALGSALVAIAGLQASAGAQPSASRIVDRTLLCATGFNGGVREVEARAHRGIRLAGTRSWKQLPFAVVASGGGARANWFLDDSLAFITAGRPTAATTLDTEWRASPALASGTLALNTRVCRAVRTPVPFESRKLRGGLAGVFGEELDCTVPGRVLVRVRALLRSPAALRELHSFLRTGVPVQEARLAVRTQAGKPLLYAEVFQSGKARLYTAKGCIPD